MPTDTWFRMASRATHPRVPQDYVNHPQDYVNHPQDYVNHLILRVINIILRVALGKSGRGNEKIQQQKLLLFFDKKKL